MPTTKKTTKAVREAPTGFSGSVQCKECGGCGELDASELVAPLGPGESFTAQCPQCSGAGRVQSDA